MLEDFPDPDAGMFDYEEASDSATSEQKIEAKAKLDRFISEERQEYLTRLMVDDAEFLSFGVEHIKENHFTNNAHRKVFSIARDFFIKHGTCPSWNMVLDRAEREFKEAGDKSTLYYMAEIHKIHDYIEPSVADRKDLIEQTEEFVRAKRIAIAQAKLFDNRYDKQKQEDSVRAMNEALDIRFGEPERVCYDIDENLDVKLAPAIVKKIFRMNEISFVFGAPGSRKTWLMIELAASISTGRPFLNRFQTHQCGVWYVIAEGADLFPLRAECWRRHHGVEKGNQNFKFVPRAYDIASRASMEQLVKHVKKYMPNCGMIVFDTLQKCFSGDADNNAEASKAIQNLEWVRDQLGGIHIAVVHHTGWGNTDREKGASAWRDAAYTTISVKKDGDESVLEVVKQKNMEFIDPIRIAFDSVTLDDIILDDEPVTGLVARVATSEKATNYDLVTRYARLALTVETELNQSALIQRIGNLWEGTVLSKDKIRTLVLKLVDDGIVIETKGAKNASYYSLAKSQDVVEPYKPEENEE